MMLNNSNKPGCNDNASTPSTKAWNLKPLAELMLKPVLATSVLLASGSLLAASPNVEETTNRPAMDKVSDEAVTGSNNSQDAETDNEEAKPKAIETIHIISREPGLRTEPGSAHALTEDDLEKFEYNDIHRILSQIPGVNFREEDGYGLRPNIGIRGASTERSQKIALMQDGILIAPAPYAAPSAYYFPLVTRMQSVEVFKGPATIKYGPNTIGGAVNLVSRSVPEMAEGQLDLAYGEDETLRLHTYYGDNQGQWSWLAEAVHWESSGFKELMDDADTGFDKNEVTMKARWQSLASSEVYQQWDVSFALSEEVSNETYLGLSDANFLETPNRRYAASQLDRMKWDHSQVFATHLAQWRNGFTVITKAYRLDFERDWTKLNGFNTNDKAFSLSNVLANPGSGTTGILYDVLRGTQDSTSSSVLMLGTNDRTYYSQGMSVEVEYDMTVFDWDHQLSVGMRLHNDQVSRHHSEEGYNMRSSRMLADGNGSIDTLRNQDEATSLALFVENEMTRDRLSVTLGLRGESIETSASKTFPETRYSEDNYSVLLPGIGMFYELNDGLGLLAGVYRGFVPSKPGQSGADPELSTNYELGVRAKLTGFEAEVVGFFSDYSNLVGNCTFSAGCVDDIDREFNGGEVHIKGVEVLAKSRFELSDALSIPVSAVYTYTDSAFQTNFNSDFSQWGEVSVGDSLPYLPEHMLTISGGVQSDNWQATLAGKYASEMQETAGFTDSALDGKVTDAHWLWDFSSSYQWTNDMSIYLTVDNALDEVALVSRRPFGARPSKPMRVMLGAKYAF